MKLRKRKGGEEGDVRLKFDLFPIRSLSQRLPLFEVYVFNINSRARPELIKLAKPRQTVLKKLNLSTV